MTKKRLHNKLVFTAKDRCKVCTFIRELPGKAIKIENGKTEANLNHCVGCGNCAKTNAQNAKIHPKSTMNRSQLLKEKCSKSSLLTTGCSEVSDYRQLFGMAKRTDFDCILDIAFDKVLIAHKYKDVLSTDTPAIAYFVKYSAKKLKELLRETNCSPKETEIFNDDTPHGYKASLFLVVQEKLHHIHTPGNIEDHTILGRSGKRPYRINF